ncbi:hypothetical protein PAAG_01429 [Paracoccidioides lutzii Pb01]|uniref:Uncharacterized protein n=1 Tax=Paracoccidioides lutzii (strain ATCC MYA-826 / Pb01) TaxID=502779 RepID=C1GSD4_PARBA|nr:hypothetical protein PAAG_01429 [Paracoccidioides lutzii Pb01]EEH38967.2 hypothetical protein PAAG_01429 [Paracoccidioides lutzii Pb01]
MRFKTKSGEFATISTLYTAHPVLFKPSHITLYETRTLRNRRAIDKIATRSHFLKLLRPLYDGMSSLLQTIRRSRLVAKRIQYPSQCTLDDYLFLHGIRGHESGTPRLLPIIVLDSLLEYMDRWSFGDPETAPCTKTRYIGIPAFKFPFPYLTDMLRFMFSVMLKIFKNLGVMYIIIWPGLAHSSMDKPWKTADWTQQRFTGATLRSYLDAYEETDHTKPGCDGWVFRCGQRVFFEIPRDYVAWMGFLKPLVGELASTTRFWADFKVRECLGVKSPQNLSSCHGGIENRECRQDPL